MLRYVALFLSVHIESVRICLMDKLWRVFV
jgi:hypothetical protein